MLVVPIFLARCKIGIILKKKIERTWWLVGGEEGGAAEVCGQ